MEKGKDFIEWKITPIPHHKADGWDLEGGRNLITKVTENVKICSPNRALSPSQIDGNLIADCASFMQIYCRDRYLQKKSPTHLFP